MIKKSVILIALLSVVLLVPACTREKGEPMKSEGAQSATKPIQLMTLDPGHFHAALVQKSMYEQISPVVYVYAPAGADLQEHLKRIDAYNKRKDNPTRWEEKVYTGPDYLQKMLSEKPGNVMVTAGNNKLKTEYLKSAVDAGIHVLADKPMCIDKTGFELLKQAFDSAKQHQVLLYDIMTERHEITSMLQKELAQIPAVFGQLQPGTPEDPAVTKESVHHFYKTVSGSPLIRPGWFYDVQQQGEGIVDVTTHLVDLVMWASFPDQIIDYTKDMELLKARRWATRISREQFERSTGLKEFPDYLKSVQDAAGAIAVYSNGEIVYTLRGIHAKVSVVWNYEAPPGGGDTHYSIMKGTQALLMIKQGKEQNYRPELYVQAAPGADPTAVGRELPKAIQDLQTKYPGIAAQQQGDLWQIVIPDSYRNGHEAHFAQVTEKFLSYVTAGKTPDWETPNMLAKYFLTTQALEMARQAK
jgi:predicted dehydrogenase